MMTSSPLQMQKLNPTPQQADAAVTKIREQAARIDANDMLYAVESSTDYNPAPNLGKIKAPVFAINSEDDEVNPPELRILEREIQKVPHGRFILIPTSDETRGHGTHYPRGRVEKVPGRAAADFRASRRADGSQQRFLEAECVRLSFK